MFHNNILQHCFCFDLSNGGEGGGSQGLYRILSSSLCGELVCFLPSHCSEKSISFTWQLARQHCDERAYRDAL